MGFGSWRRHDDHHVYHCPLLIIEQLCTPTDMEATWQDRIRSWRGVSCLYHRPLLLLGMGELLLDGLDLLEGARAGHLGRRLIRV